MNFKNIIDLFFLKNKSRKNKLPYEIEKAPPPSKHDKREMYTIDYKENKIIITFLHISSSINKDSIEKKGLIPFSPQELRKIISNYLSINYNNFNSDDFFNRLKQGEGSDKYTSLLNNRIIDEINASNTKSKIYANYLPSDEYRKESRISTSNRFKNGGEFIECAENLYLEFHPEINNTANIDRDVIFCLIEKELTFQDGRFSYVDDSINENYPLTKEFEEIFKGRGETRFEKAIPPKEINILSKQEFSNLTCNLISKEALEYLDTLRNKKTE